MVSVAVIGAGVVGEATGYGFKYLGHKVTLVDVNPDRVAQLHQQGYSAVHVEELSLEGTDLIFVSVPTPTREGMFLSTHLEDAARAIGRALRYASQDQYRVVVWRSTMLPGMTRQRLLPLLENYSGKLAGQHFGIAVQPEFLRADSSREDFLHPKAIVVGVEDCQSEDLLRKAHTPFEAKGVKLITFPSWEAVEFLKYVHNLLNATRISFFNEMRQAGLALGIEPRDVQLAFESVAKTAEGSWNPYYGIKDLGPFGGTCLPKDTQAFALFAQELGIPMPVLNATIAVNNSIAEDKTVEVA